MRHWRRLKHLPLFPQLILFFIYAIERKIYISLIAWFLKLLMRMAAHSSFVLTYWIIWGVILMMTLAWIFRVSFRFSVWDGRFRMLFRVIRTFLDKYFKLYGLTYFDQLSRMLARRLCVVHLVSKYMIAWKSFMNFDKETNLDLGHGWHLPNLDIPLNLNIRLSLILDQA